MKSWNEVLLNVIVAAGSEAGVRSEQHALLYAGHALPVVSLEDATEAMNSAWPSEGELAFELPEFLFRAVTEQVRSELLDKLLHVAEASAKAATEDVAVQHDTVTNYMLYLGCALELQDALIDNGHIEPPTPSAETLVVQQAVIEAARAEGREADFAEVLIAIAEHMESSRR